jgi:hypothetical protein
MWLIAFLVVVLLRIPPGVCQVSIDLEVTCGGDGWTCGHEKDLQDRLPRAVVLAK